MAHLRFSCSALVVFLLHLLLPESSATVQAQTGSVTGVVTDAKTKAPMPLAVVFVAHTTIGTTTDENGRFVLYNVPLGTVEIVASFIGYANAHRQIEINGKVELNLSLQAKENTLNEVKVVARYGKDWQKNLKRFREAFIGVSGNAPGCTIVNPETLSFEYDQNTGKLTAKAAAPLEIENRALGYKLTFFLEKFESVKDLTKYYGFPKFELLKTTSKGREARWKRNRRATYQGSIYHFLRSLVYQRWEQEGFLAYHDQRKVPTSQFYQMVGQRLFPIQAGELVGPGKNASERSFSFDGKLEIVYTKKQTQFPLYHDFNYEHSSIEMNVPSIDINVEGWANGLLPLKISGDMSLHRIADLLPFDYLPEGTNRQLPAPPPASAGTTTGNPALDSLLVHYARNHQWNDWQKVYVHLDRPYYRSGDEMWFKVYLTNRAGIPVARLSEVLTVELLSADGKLVHQVSLQTRTAWAAGAMRLSDTLTTGMYRLRAYTQRMRALGSRDFFDRPLEIYNVYPASPTPTATPTARSRRKNKTSEQTAASDQSKTQTLALTAALDVQFFPEGGNLVENLSGRLGFKAVGPDGRGRKVRGFVEDEQGNREISFESNDLGMGSFFIKPLAGRKYKAVLAAKDSGFVFALPAPLKSGISLKLDNVHFASDIFLNLRVSPTYLGQDFYIVVQCRGTIYYVGKSTFDEELTTLKLPKAKFPGGVCQLTLFDQQATPVCERLFFSQPHPVPLRIRMVPEKSQYQFREKITLNLQVTDTADVAVDASLSLAITDAAQAKADTYALTARSYLLLASDLRGCIENPEFYFKDTHTPTLEALENLLMTQGWRRFAWQDFRTPPVRTPTSVTDSGFVLKGVLVDASNPDKKLARHTLLFISQDSVVKGFIQTTTDAKGVFQLNKLSFQDSLQVFVQVTDPEGQSVRGALLWNIPEPDSTLSSFLPRLWFSSQKADSTIRYYQQTLAMYGDRTMRTQVLKEVVVKATAVKNQEEDYRGTTKLYDMPDGSILVDARTASASSIYELIRGRLPGVAVNGPNADGRYTVTIRGSISFGRGSSEPLFLLDGVPISANGGDGVDLNFISPNDVVRIDVIKNAGASIYGSRGATGIIAIYTRKGPRTADKKPGAMVLWLNGFQTPRQFYQPRYDVAADSVRRDERATLYWNPDLKLDEEGKATIEFYNSDRATQWNCVLEGISVYGQPVSRSVVIENGRR
jgi:hypothetical protein